MALKIYESADSSSAFSINGEFSNPIAHSFNGVTGGTVIKKYYLRNDDNTKYYNNITISAYVGSGQNITNGTNGFSWKFISGASQPLEAEWTLVSDGNSISMSQIGSYGSADTTTYYPFWIRITVPDNLSAQSFENATLRISLTENIA